MKTKIAIAVTIVAVMLATTLGTLKVTSSPQFCGSCHEMTDYVDGWRESIHKSVTCTSCHFEPGLVSYAKGKLGAIRYIKKHFTQTEFDPQAVVADTTCLHCHDTLLSNKELKMDHSIAVKMEAKCSQCHKLGHKKLKGCRL